MPAQKGYALRGLLGSSISDPLRLKSDAPGGFVVSVVTRFDRSRLAGHYGFTAEELDFILNYDIKYRLGRDSENEGE